MAYRDWGSKTGGGGVASADQQALQRKERLRQLAIDTVDVQKDPYLLRNHLGSYECRLCLTLHANEGNYLAHTQGRRHQTNLKRRAALDARKAPPPRHRAPLPAVARSLLKRSRRIGTPAYQVTKQRDPQTRQLSLLFHLSFQEIAPALQPRHRFMSAFEQSKEAPDRRYQFLLFAADPYETVAFKIPNKPIDKSDGKFYSHWDPDAKNFTLQLYFENHKT